MPISSFNCRETERLFATGKSRVFSDVRMVAERKLAQLAAAHTLDFLRSPPGNRLERLRGKHTGQYSIRINDQWRICFRWTSEGPTDVEIVDYH